ncbi:MAG: hypothetical protein ACYCQJ_10355 [Nitrososphaerales archaeon]
MIHVKIDRLGEQHLAEIALAIQNRWNVATFVKMHEIMILDDEQEVDSRLVTAPLDPRDIERGMQVILENLELDHAFKLEKNGRDKFTLKLVNPDNIPKWVQASSTIRTQAPPEGVYECAHCGRRFNTEIEWSLHTKLHYII